MDSLRKRFYCRYPDLKDNQAVESFLSRKENREILEEFLSDPSDSAEDCLNEAFKAHFFGIRFTSYVSSSLYFHSVNFDKKTRMDRDRQLLTLDKPLGDEEEGTYKELIADTAAPDSYTEKSLEESISDARLMEAFQRLTHRQKFILNLAYVEERSDTEIADVLGVSQQAVSKTHKKVLKKLKNALEKGENE
ncbi:sigma-70 family RNA polymerase sigma factor [Bacillus sp. SG-1]|uniref:sigma-70 family RNA polymerase sigma factor n=1 Tax=Bacillus sp. SG-1 TaxID=161544 RepID=UPI00015446AB|nr:sigma-70 family RNA polymerase sigma factor [Bacillus sp. SG-1]EDL63464.1 possible RNA polymerase sigma-B factor (Sigma-37) (General stress protein84) (GSP84) [Bacillus sp. SG-1]